MSPRRKLGCGIVLAALALAGACSGQDPLAPGSASDAGGPAPPDAGAGDDGGSIDTGADLAPSGATADAGDGPGKVALALSDGFETVAAGGPPDKALWNVVAPDCSGSGTVAVDGTVAHTGNHSLRVDGGGGYCDHIFVANTSAIATLGGQVYARVFVRLGAALGTGHTTFLAMKDGADGGDVRMGGQDSVLIYNRESDDATLPVLSPTGVADSIAPAPSTWVCIEFSIDETAGTIDTWVDGREVPGLVEDGAPVADISTEWLAHAWRPSLVDFRLGWESYAGQAMTLWFDDVGLAVERIGCGP